MNRLNNINRNGGFPLVAENVDILNENMQILESVIKGLDIPNNYVIRFRDSDYAYYQGKILKITTGNALPNSAAGERREVRIFTNDNDVVDSGGITYTNAYTEEELRIYSALITDPLDPHNSPVKIYDFSELIDKSLWQQCDFISLKQNGSDVATTDAIHQVRYNAQELRIRTVFKVVNLPVNNELRLIYDCPAFDTREDVVTLMATFNGNNNWINHFIPAYLNKNAQGEIIIKIAVDELQGLLPNGDNDFTGQITLNGIAVL